MIGATTSQSLDLILINKGDMVYGTSTIKVEIGLKIGSIIEYIPIGIYNIDDIEKTDYTIKITAFDNMIKFETPYFSTLGDTPTLQQVVNELASKTGVQFTGSLPAYNVKKLEGFTCREILGYVASLCGGNAVITRDGKFTIVTPKDNSYSIGTANYIDYKREETKYKIGKVSCQAGEEVLSKGSLGTDSMELQFENPWVNATILTDIYNKLNGFEYLGYSMKWQGDLSLDVGDIVTITDKKGVVRKHPILSQKFTYTGGLTSEISAKGENKNKNSYSSSGSTSNKVERVVMELALINKALIDVAYIGDLTAGNIKFDTASGNTLDLQTLLSKFVTGENGQFLNITSSNTVIANAVIKDAMIDSINAAKINAGTINSNLVEIKDSNGNLSIKDNTIQIKDDNRVRVQIGKDANNDYSMYVWDTDGKLMFDATGLKADGIKTPIIRDDMVADNANISGNKLNIGSVIESINNDNTRTLKSSKILVDSTGQSLEVSFNSLKSVAEDTKSKTESNTTSINVINGQIATLIIDTTIEEDGATVKLKDSYSNLKQTVSGINATIASHSTSISNLTNNLNAVSGKVTTVENKQATLEQNIEGFKTTVSNTYTTKTEYNTLNGTVTSIQQRVNTVEQKITATALTTTISSAINAGTSTITTTQFVMDKTGFTVKNGAIKILNKAGQTVLSGDTNGNLTVKGTITGSTITGSTITGSEIISQNLVNKQDLTIEENGGYLGRIVFKPIVKNSSGVGVLTTKGYIWASSTGLNIQANGSTSDTIGLMTNKVNVDGNISFNNVGIEQQLRFEGAGSDSHLCYFYSGSSSSSTRIGLYDKDRSSSVWRWLTSNEFQIDAATRVPRIYGNGGTPSFYVGTGGCRIEADSALRLYTSWMGNADNGINIGTDGSVQIKCNSVNRHIFFAGGTKTGGTMEVEGTVYGMSPTDSPQTLIEYIIPDTLIHGELKLELDPIYIKMISYYVAFLSNKNIEIKEKGQDYIILAGNGTTDILIKGQRKDADDYFRIMGGIEHGVTEGQTV